MNWVDLVIIGALLVFVIDALGRPLFLEVLDLISFLLALILSFRYYNLLAKFFETQFQIPHGLSLVLGFMAAWFLAEGLFYLVVRIFIPKLPRLKFPYVNTLSAIPALFRGLIFVSIFLVLLSTFPIQPQIKKGVLSSRIGSAILKNAYTLEQPLKQVFGGVTNDTLTFLTIKPKTDEKVDLGFKTVEYTIDATSENAMIDLVNKERASRDLPALVIDANLRDIARSHSEDMFKRGYFSHFSPEEKTVADRANEAGVDFLIIGENLAYAPNVDFAHKGLMLSEGHRANILSPDYGKIGIGVIDGGVYGEMFTQVFTN